ncbi:MAG: tRNA threonylcarbamoyladenosine dehydratase, partial [Clostridia bacterium]|nr:tRNA threonylcarbamoyladenosine dehydratase [Clostridia bacterium]
GEEAMKKLNDARVAVFGIGGVGGYVCEALVRSGVGHFDLVDKDTVSVSNLNRQIIAAHSSIGRLKTEVMRERMLDINPDADIRVYNTFFLPGNSEDFPFDEYDYVVDAVDTVTAKLELIQASRRAGVPVISSMGTGNKLSPGNLKVADIYETRVCPLARVMRRELKKRGVEGVKVVYSDEEPVAPAQRISSRDTDEAATRKDIPGSTAFVPGSAGLMIASEIIRDIISE